MTNPHNPDPLHWPELEPPDLQAVRLMRDRETSDEHGSHGWLGLVLLAVAGLLLLALGWGFVLLLAALQDAATERGPAATSEVLATPATAGGGSSATSLVPTAPRTISGTATWYCLSGSSACTRGYGQSDLVAAIDTDLGFRKGDHVTVTYRGRSVTVRIVDVCACPGDRLIDLTSGAFRRLADLHLGVIPVSLRLAGPAVTLPPTDTDTGGNR